MENKNGDAENYGTAHWDDNGHKSSGNIKSFQRSPGLYVLLSPSFAFNFSQIYISSNLTSAPQIPCLLNHNQSSEKLGRSIHILGAR